MTGVAGFGIFHCMLLLSKRCAALLHGALSYHRNVTCLIGALQTAHCLAFRRTTAPHLGQVCSVSAGCADTTGGVGMGARNRIFGSFRTGGGGTIASFGSRSDEPISEVPGRIKGLSSMNLPVR